MININKILFPTDFSRCADQALSYACQLARKHDAELHMLHAIVLHEDDPHNPAYHFPDKSKMCSLLEEQAKAQMKTSLQGTAAEVKVSQVQQTGISAAPVILDYACDNDIDLIVMGTHGRRGLGHLFLGSVAEEVVRMAPCAVLTVREQKELVPLKDIESIIVPIDFSEYCKLALRHAVELASSFNAKLHLLHIVEESIHPSFYVTGKTSIFELVPGIKEKSIEALQKIATEVDLNNVEFDVIVEQGRAASDIVKYTEEYKADMIVIATHGLTGLQHLLLGSVTEKVVRRAGCPVFTVKPFGKSILKS